MVLRTEEPLQNATRRKGIEGPMAAAKQRNPLKVQRAAADPQRPGEACKAEPGASRPVVNRARCEGKSDCIEVCPYDVFEVRTIDRADYEPLPFFSRLKIRVHGMKTAYTPRADACRACGLCVVACPEKAITLEAAPAPVSAPEPGATAASETQQTVLLLEDEPTVRRATSRMLRSLGYEVLDTSLPSEALALAREHAGRIDVFVTDVVMPEMSGVEAARAFREARPEAVVLFVSGQSRNALNKAMAGAPPRHLAKPFSKMELATALREVLTGAQ